MSVKCLFTYVLNIPQGHRCVEHEHDCCEIGYCIDCDGVLIQDGLTTPYEDHSVFVYQPGGRHLIVNNAEGRHICIGISGRGVAALAPGVRHGCGELGWLFGRIAQAASSDSASKSERLDHLCALIALELRELAVSDASTPPLAPGRRAQAIIDDSFDTAHDVASLAKQVYLSPDYFRSVFKREVGQPVTKYLIGKRIDHARLLLTSTDTTVAQIAEECGFSSPYYFSRMFKKYSGISPAEFRKKGPSE